MTETLRVTLLGSPRVQLGDQPLTDFATNKAQALLFYLIVTGQPHSRDLLATLLWDDMSDVQAKKNLRTVLPNLRRMVGDYLHIDRQTIAFDTATPYWLDVEELRRGLLYPSSQGTVLGPSPLASAVRQQTLDLYQGEFLSGFYVHNASGFDAWVLQQREQIHAQVIQTLSALVDEQTKREEYAAALAANRQLLQLEPWSEAVHRQQMLLLARTGERIAALAQYETCQRILATEFGVSPIVETTSLYEQIRAGTVGALEEKSPAQLQPIAHDVQQGMEIHTDAHDQATESLLPLQITGHVLPLQTQLYGRQSDLERLRHWVVDNGCRLVGLLGIGGQGKTALAASLVRELAAAEPGMGGRGNFTHVIWHSLVNAPPLADLMHEWIYLLSDQSMTDTSMSLDQQFRWLIDQLRYQRCLLVLDNLESVLDSNERGGYYRPGYEAYGQLLRHLAEGEHRSCLLLTSREQPWNLIHLEEETPSVRFLSLAGLPMDAGRQMLTARGMESDPTSLTTLVQQYSGNPLALKLVAETVQEIFDSNIAAFLQAQSPVFDDIRDVLDHQFARLTPLERELLVWLAIVREPIAYPDLRHLLAQPPAARLVLEAVRSLQRRSLLEKFDQGFGLQNVVMEYTTEWLVERVGHELFTALQSSEVQSVEPPGSPASSQKFEQALSHAALNCVALMVAQSKEYVRASQTRLLLQPAAERLQQRAGRTGAIERIQTVLAHLRQLPPTPGYATTNLLHLLLHLGIDLRGYDFSNLYLRQLYLRGVNLPQVSFAGSELIECVFTEPFGLVYTVTVSPGGRYLAAGTSEGAIYLWRTSDQQLAHTIRVHGQPVLALAFAQRPNNLGSTDLVLASSSDDGKVCLYNVDNHQVNSSDNHHDNHHGADKEKKRPLAQYIHEQHKPFLNVAFDPCGHRITTIDEAGQVFVWDTNPEQQLTHHEPVQQFTALSTRWRLVAYSADGQVMAVGNRDGAIQLWQVATGRMVQEFTVETEKILTLALSDDGQWLATGSRNGRLSIWNLSTGSLQHELETKSTSIDALAFSPEGNILASAHGVGDHAVRIWTIDAQKHLQLHQTLRGHTHMIWSIAFGPQPTPDSPMTSPRIERQLLITGSSDQTVRVWDVETGHSLYTRHGQPRALAALAIKPLVTTKDATLYPTPPAEWLLAAAGYDQCVHVWRGQGKHADGAAQHMRGAANALYAAAFSPDGRTIASGGHDKQIYLWDSDSGQLQKTLSGHIDNIEDIAFQPQGALLASGAVDGTVHLWELLDQYRTQHPAGIGSDRPVAVIQANPRGVYDIGFSSDGQLLASVGGDLSVRVWDLTTPHQPQLVDLRTAARRAGEQNLFSVAFSPDGKTLACGGNQHIYLWALPGDSATLIAHKQSEQAEYNLRCLLQQHTSRVFAVAFSPDGSTLASASEDYTVCLWDATCGTLRMILHGHTEPVYDVAFTPDGAFALSCSADGTIRFWDAETGGCVNIIRVDGPYAGTRITDAKGITEAQKLALIALGAVD